MDLGNNQIQELDIEQVPKTVEQIKLLGNPCTQETDYKYKLINHLEGLVVLDELEIDDQEKLRVLGMLDEDEIMSETESTGSMNYREKLQEYDIDNELYLKSKKINV